ncbi:MAG: Ig-like domain-containing protein [Betaproteobacteria bacterium]
MRKQSLVLGIIALAAACAGGSPSAPSVPPTTAGTVKAIRVTASESLEAGKKTQLQATALYSDGTEGAITSEAEWTSATPDLVTVGPTGVAAGLKYGQATIRASFAGQVGELRTLVFGRPVAVTVHLASFDCIADCDDSLNGDGDFVYRVRVEADSSTKQSATYQTPGYPSSSGEFRLGPGEQHTINASKVFNVRDEPPDRIIITFDAIEWDTLGKDGRLSGSGKSASFGWTEAGAWGSAPGRHTITLGSGGCVVRLEYDLSFDYIQP